MKFPRLFVQNGLQARKDAIEVLNKYFKLLNVKDYCNVMDVGCGPGNVSHDLLYPLLPNTTKKFIGIDISPKMIEFANHNYRKSSKIKFSVMDIVTDNIPENYKAEFDHIISLYCLHFVNDHRKALLNMHTMLKPGGNVLLNFMANRVFMDIYKRMAEMTEWKTHFQKLKEIEPPTEYCDNSKIYYEGLLREIGFEPHLCFETKKYMCILKNYLQIR
ncbi:hypothetical protein FQA39_LY02406 [Lamprigera yunnana]|nr:hypothetical protein FQA39_LY02406 [Lamprigera yunnana]